MTPVPIAILVREDGTKMPAYSEAELDILRQKHEACGWNCGWDYEVYRLERMTTTGSAIETVAHHVVAAAVRAMVDSGRIEWEDYPDIGESDFTDVINHAFDLAPYPDFATLNDAYELLRNKAVEPAALNEWGPSVIESDPEANEEHHP